MCDDGRLAGAWIALDQQCPLALVGDASDNIPGVPGVGEVYAIRHMQNPTDKSRKVYRKILSKRYQEVIAQNLKLVTLPLKGTMEIKLQKDKIQPKKWNRVIENLGMKSLRKED